MACFEQSKTLRKEILGEFDESVADCYYNIGVIALRVSLLSKALKNLEVAAQIRGEIFGEESLEAAEVFEAQGFAFMMQNEFISAFSKLK